MIVKYCSIRHIMLSVVLFFCVALKAHAQIEVSSVAGDDSKGSLIAAIQWANAQKSDPKKPVTIRFAKKMAGEIVLSMDLPPIQNHISFVGNLENGKPTVTINGSVNPEINEGLKGGYRVITNIGADGGQTIFHIHFHLIGGREFHGLVPNQNS